MSNFVVPSDHTLRKADAIYKLDASETGVLKQSLTAFANVNNGRDCKLSIDGKKISIGYGDKFGDEDLDGHESPPTLNQRKYRLDQELETLQTMNNDLTRLGEVDPTKLTHTLQSKLKSSLLDLIPIISYRIRQLKEMNVKTKRAADALIKKVNVPSWMASKVAHAISYFRGKSIMTNTCINDLLVSVDNIGFYISVLNGTQVNYVRGTNRVVHLHQQSNYVCLRQLNSQCIKALDLATNSTFIKQRSPEWHHLRGLARITGSTLYAALGLDSLKERKLHHDMVFAGRHKKYTEAAQTAMLYGTQNEINALATVVSKFVPVYYPGHYCREDGCSVSRIGDARIVVSGDGTLVRHSDDVGEVSLELKCPVPGKLFTTDHAYELPKRYSTQVLSQMALKNNESYLNACYTPHSTTFITGVFDLELWSNISNITSDMYRDGAKRPNHTDERSGHLKEKMKEFSHKSKFIAEFPSVSGAPCSHETAQSTNEAYQHHHKEPVSNMVDAQPHEPQCTQTWADTIVSIKDKLTAAYNLLRRPAKEVLVSLISDLDRQGIPQLANTPHAIPVMYHLSGYSLKMKSVRGIIADGIQACKNQNLNVKVVAFDGQFVEISTTHADGTPLTLCKLQKKAWNDACSMKKDAQFALLYDANNVGVIRDYNDLTNFMQITKATDGRLEVRSINGMQTLLMPPNIGELITKNNLREPQCISVPAANITEDHILQYLPDEIRNQLEGDALEIIKQANELINTSKEIPMSNVTELVITGDDIITQDHQAFLVTDQFLESVLVSLITLNEDKWKTVLLDDIKVFLHTAEHINRSFTVPELKLLLSMMGIKVAPGIVKSEIVNTVSQRYGDGSNMSLRPKSPKSLKVLIKHTLQKWPKMAMNALIATNKLVQCYDEWCESSTFKNGTTVITEDGTSFAIPYWYAQPSNSNGELIQYIIDPHHIFVNNRSRCCTKGMPGMGVSSQAWFKIALDQEAADRTGLSLELVKELRDKQRNSFAQTTFSEDVEAEMRKNNDFAEANWCSLIRNWYHAVDEAGIATTRRLYMLLTMRKHLLSMFNFGIYPPHGNNVNGLPMTQFEGILCNIDRRIQLYAMTDKSTYNQRAVSSLDSETFFSGFQASTYICIIVIVTPGFIMLIRIHFVNAKEYPVNFIWKNIAEMD